ncbi:helix-turn-helix transcriptional regulator [Ancrocorticia sp.]|uniref:helix-turn-helix transcriptional regulator n=1 Tax=Ancrocorticia sp. TaxID=2593684 RepID=UPI003F9168AF
MANVRQVVRTNAILTYLSHKETATLGHLADHFDMRTDAVLKLLWDANLVEVVGMPIPFDLQLPDPEDAGRDAVVGFSDMGSGHIPPLPLGLDEAIVLVALIDQVLEVTAPGPASEALRDLRIKLAEAAEAAGFASAMWPEPESPIAPTTLTTLTGAIADHRHLTITYHRQGSDLHERVDTIDLIPLAISTGTSPTLRAAREVSGRLELRNYRLDRISSATAGEEVARGTWRAANALPGQPTWVPDGPTVTLTLTRGAKWAAETLPGAVTTESEGILTMSLPITSEEWLFSLLAQLGDTVVAVDPPEISDHMAARARALEENQ